MTKKTHFTRKNYIAFAMVFFYACVNMFVAACIDTTSAFGKQNFLLKFATQVLMFPKINAQFNAYILVTLFNFFVVIFAAAYIFERRTAIFYNENPSSKKYITTYILTLLGCVVLWLGISIPCQYPDFANNLSKSFLFFLEMLLVGLIIYLALAVFIFCICALYVNFKNIDKPFRFNADIDNETEEDVSDPNQEERSSLEDVLGDGSQLGNNSNTGVNGNNSGGLVSSGEEIIGDANYIFPGLTTIDKEELADIKLPYAEIENLSLSELANNFRNYLAQKEHLYYDINTIRAFLAGLGASRLIILEGLSGTGKSSLARYFSEYISEDSFFEAIQATYRDRTSLLGYYNDFSKKYNETEFLKRLYKMTYRPEDVNIMVLDEMNIARIEYYFADFLSIMEYPMDKWNLKVMELPYDFKPPVHLENGFIKIPNNTWFIGTANKDDSTYTITDKVYDRAITISFDNKNEPFEVEGDYQPIQLSYRQLNELFDLAKQKEEYRMSKDDYSKFFKLTNFVYDTFEVAYGNRILNQIDNFIPVFVGLGGSKQDGLDFMFARKIISKLDGRLEDYIKQGLIDLKALIVKTYGDNSFELTMRAIDSLIRKL